MKLLLTSSGLSHKAIGLAMVDLVGKPASETKVGFVPTAANVEPRKKDWLINELLQLWRHGYSWIDIVDISAPGVDWRTRLAEVDVVYLPGGDPFHLLDQTRKTGFDAWLKEALRSKVYVGGSASAVLVAPTIKVAEAVFEYPSDIKLTDLSGLGYVNFEVVPHCDMALFEKTEAYAKAAKSPVYAIDDLTAIQVIDGQVTVISQGTWKLYE